MISQTKPYICIGIPITTEEKKLANTYRMVNDRKTTAMETWAHARIWYGPLICMSNKLFSTCEGKKKHQIMLYIFISNRTAHTHTHLFISIVALRLWCWCVFVDPDTGELIQWSLNICIHLILRRQCFAVYSFHTLPCSVVWLESSYCFFVDFFSSFYFLRLSIHNRCMTVYLFCIRIYVSTSTCWAPSRDNNKTTTTRNGSSVYSTSGFAYSSSREKKTHTQTERTVAHSK